MRRMALNIALIVVALSTLLFVADEVAVFGLTLVLLVSAVACLCFRNKLKKYISSSAVLLFCAAFGLYIILFNHFTVVKTSQLAGKSGKVTCYVTEEPQAFGDMSVLYVKTSNKKHENSGICKSINLSIWVSADEPLFDAKVGDVFTADVTFKEIDEAYRKSSYAKGIYVSASAQNFSITGHKFSLYEKAVDIRQAVRRVINQHFSGDKRGILNGVVLGSTGQMSERLYNDFVFCGVIHITSVSGLHISVICMAIITLLELFMRRRLAVIVAMVPVLAVVAVTGFHASALRAGVMCVIAFLGEASLKRTDGLNSLGLAVTGMLIINPFYVLDLGFCLSCTATAGVIVATKTYDDKIKSRVTFKNRKVNRVVHAAGTIFFQSAGAVVFTLPLQVLEFGFVSVISPIAGVAICAAVAYTLVLAVLGIILCFIPFLGVVSNLIFAVVWLLLEYIETAIHSLATIPFSYIPFGHYSALLWMGLGMALVGIWYLLGSVGGKRFVALLLSALLLVSLWGQKYSASSVVEISLINLQKGFSVVIYYGEKCVIIGCGDESSDAYIITRELRLHGVTTVEAILLPSDSENCTGGAATLTKFLKMDKSACLPTEGFEMNLHDGVKLTAIPHEKGCSYLLSAYDKQVLIGFGKYSADKMTPDVLFSNGALPSVDEPQITVISDDWLPLLIESKYGKVYYKSSSSVSVKIKQGKEIVVYAR